MSDPTDPTQSHPGPMASLAGVSEGTVLDGRYRLEERLGRGGTAEVYRATDELLGRAVAVKVFDSRLTDLNTVMRQRNEMQVLATLNHPNLVAVYDARIASASASGRTATPQPGNTSSGHTYLVMELVVGMTLADLLARGAVSPVDVARLGSVLATVLSVVHSRDLVHRDIKPANILVAESGQIKLGDFGLARILTAENRLTTGGEVMGTAAYFSPEQARGGEVGPSADIYSLGLVLLECLTGVREFPGRPVEAAVARLLRDPAVPTDLAAPWPQLLAAMTDANPALRPTAAQVAETLQQHFEAGTAGPSPVTAASRTIRSSPLSGDASTAGWSTPLSPFLLSPDSAPDRRRRRRTGLLVAGVTGVAAVVAISLMVAQPDATGPVGGPVVPASSKTSSMSTPPSAASTSVGVRPPSTSGRTATAPPATSAARSATPTSSPPRSSTVRQVVVITDTAATPPAPASLTTASVRSSAPAPVPTPPTQAPTTSTTAASTAANSSKVKETKTKAPRPTKATHTKPTKEPKG